MQVSTAETQSSSDKAMFVSENYPDNTQVSGGTAFAKTWTIKNSGTMTWNSSYKLRYVSGSLGVSHGAVSISGTVAPGGSYTFSVAMVAPAAASTAQTCTENWKFVNPSGTQLVPLWATIIVPVKPVVEVDKATFVSENYPDNTQVPGGTAFVKTWTIRNDGTTNWGSGYRLQYIDGILSATHTDFALSATVAPGKNVTFSVNMVAPGATNVAKTYKETWKFVNPAGVQLTPVWALVVVPSGGIDTGSSGGSLKLNVGSQSFRQEGGTNSVIIMNVGAQSVSWKVSGVPAWITNLSPQNGTLTSGATQTVNLQASSTTTTRDAAIVFYNAANASNKANLFISQAVMGSHTYDAYFIEAGQKYGVPVNLLRALAYVESGWTQASHSNTNDWGVMQLHEDTDPNKNFVLSIAQVLRNGATVGATSFTGWSEYAAMTDQQIIDLLKDPSDRGAQANIRGGAYWLRKNARPPNIFDCEPLNALESWWFAVTAYNGAWVDGDTRISNYPFHVYNCFIRPELNGYKVPPIPITLPPHVSFLRVTSGSPGYNGLRRDGQQLIPVSPEFEYDNNGNLTAGFLRVTEPFNSCTDLRILHDDNGAEIKTDHIVSCTDSLQIQPSPFKLKFPLRNYSPFSPGIMTSLFDYSQGGSTGSSPFYNEDGYVVAFTGEFGWSTNGSDPSWTTLKAYKNSTGSSFSVNGLHQNEYIYYDGHPGYDYSYTGIAGTDILATAAGTFHLDGAGCNMAHIDHGNGYCTYYLHSDSYSVANGASVKAGDVIGKVGSAGTTGGAHLHLEIKKNGNYVDPYGWQRAEDCTYSWTRAAQSILWENAGSIGGLPFFTAVKSAKPKIRTIADLRIQRVGGVWSIGAADGSRLIDVRVFDRLGRIIPVSSVNATAWKVAGLTGGLFVIRARFEDGRSLTRSFCFVK